jgi:hypothetical protein
MFGHVEHTNVLDRKPKWVAQVGSRMVRRADAALEEKTSTNDDKRNS